MNSNLADFQRWVDEWADDIGQAAGQGDVRKVYKGVKVLAGKPQRPSPNITTDHDGNTLQGAEDVAQAWNRFLSAKFSATDTEQLWRPEREELPDTKFTDELTEEQFSRGLAKMSNNKACGPDNIPAELYKRVPICKNLLYTLLFKIWHTEEVPVAFARATFRFFPNTRFPPTASGCDSSR